MRIKVLVILLLSSCNLFADNKDSLQAILPQLQQQEKIAVLLQLSHLDTNRFALLEEARILSRDINYRSGEANALLGLGQYHYDKEQYELAQLNFEESHLLYKTLKDENNQLKSLQGLARSNYKTRVYDVSLEYTQQLEVLARAKRDTSTLAFVYTQMARIKGAVMKEVPIARQYLRQAISLYEKIGLQSELPKVYNDLGVTYSMQQQYDSCIFYLKKGLAVADANNHIEEMRLLRSNISSSYIDLQEYDTALIYSHEAMELSIKNQRKDFLSFDYLVLGLIHLQKKQYPQSLEYANKGRELAESISNFTHMEWSYDLLKRIYKDLGDYKKSTQFAESILQVRDSINTTENIRKLTEKEAAFRFNEQQKEIESLAEAAYYQRLIRNGIILLALAFIAILILLINRNRVVMRLQRQELDRLSLIEQMKEKEKELLKDKLKQQERQLASNTMQLLQKNEMLNSLKEDINNMISVKNTEIQPQIRNLNRTIEQNINLDDDWQKFRLHFEQVHSDFFDKLSQKSVTLNNNDIRFCAYIKMGLTTKEIAQMMGINVSSVQKARYRLKRKLALEKSTNLIEFIQRF